MKLSYQHANPSTGGGSYLLRFRDATRVRTACVLVDAGADVDLDALLGDDEYLAAVLLTHAHLDHYASLADSLRDGAPVYAAEPTADVLGDVLAEGEKNYDIGAVDRALDAVEPLAGWETLLPDVSVAPVPAGHAPGAAGFVVRFRDGSRDNHLLFTGDFTTRPVAGYPGLRTDLPVAVDALFVNVSTAEAFRETLTEALFTVVERSRAGSAVLATASALTAVHCAYLLGHLGERLDEAIPVTLAGQAAKLYADLGYDAPNVEAVPVFDSADDLLDRGAVALAGPEVPSEGSARSLFGAIRDDASATLVQLIGGPTDPVETATCTVYDYEVVNHSSLPVIDDLVAALDPIHVVAGHGSRAALRDFRGRYDERFVWASDDARERTLYDDGRWASPPWLSDVAVKSIRAQDWRTNGNRFGDGAEAGDETLPPVARTADVNLEAEGVDVERFVNRFGPDDAATTLPATRSAVECESVESETVESESVESAASSPEPKSNSQDSDSLDGACPPPAEAAASDTEAFRREVLDRLGDIESAVSGRRCRARVVEGDDGETLLRLSVDVDLDPGDEVDVVLTDDGE